MLWATRGSTDIAYHAYRYQVVAVELLVGCPVSHREWVLPSWFDHVEASCLEAKLAPRYVFVGDEADPSFSVVRQRAPEATVVAVTDPRPHDRRHWDGPRYHRMVELRNGLLGAVRRIRPGWFLSLDSDILLHPRTIASLCAALAEGYDAVGARCYMTRWGLSAPSCGQLSRLGTLQRPDCGGLIGVDVIMAAKLMSPTAYGVDYRFDLQGEDIGWSKACLAAGLRLGWDGRTISKHILDPTMLGHVDSRVGY